VGAIRRSRPLRPAGPPLGGQVRSARCGQRRPGSAVRPGTWRVQGPRWAGGHPGVFRHTYTEDGRRSDEAFTRKLRWEYSTSLISAERGGLQDEFIEITEDEAGQIVEQSAPR
jgi:hypothetical protein